MKTTGKQAHRAAAATLVLAVSSATGVALIGAGPADAAPSYGKVSAHRGGDYGPDNTLKAFNGALAAGIQDIEGDVYFTTDQVGVMHHDNSLKDCGSSRTITGSSWAQVQGLKCADGGRPTKLADVLRAFLASANKTAVLRVEVKHTSGESAATQQAKAKLLVQRLQEKKMTGRAIVQDFSWRTTAGTIRATQPGIRVSCLESDVSAADVTLAKSRGCSDVSYNYANWHDGLNARIHGAGMQVAVWTVNSRANFVRFKDALHANVIITDLPSQARHW